MEIQKSFNWGFWDARNDSEKGTDRRKIETGQLFSLPKSDTPKMRAYRLGYDFGHREEFQNTSTSESAWERSELTEV